MDDIADKLGCSKKTLYVFFENRKDLVLKVISNDMKKHELEISNIFDKKNRQLTYKVSIQNLKKGIKEGCYRKEINPEIISKIFSEKIDVIFNSLAFEAINVSFSDVYKELINHHVLGIVNEEGRKYYLNFQKTTK